MRGLAAITSLALSIAACGLAACALSGCGEGNDGSNEHDTPQFDPVDVTTSALAANDSVATAIGQTCSTNVLGNLSKQLLEEIECLRANTMGSIDKVPNLVLQPGVQPFIQAAAASALKKVVAARGGATLTINSSIRTLPEQLMLYQWYLQKRCDILRAASPGNSNHETGTAVDVQDNAAWRNAFESNGWVWFGSTDPYHYDYKGGGTVNLGGLSVQAFQRLWNRNNAQDPIAEDGAYGPMTEARLLKTPIGGFAKGATCKDPKPVVDAGPPDTGTAAVGEPTVIDSGAPTPTPNPTVTTNDEEASDELRPSSGCSAANVRKDSSPMPIAFVLLGLSAVLSQRKTRRRSASAVTQTSRISR